MIQILGAAGVTCAALPFFSCATAGKRPPGPEPAQGWLREVSPLNRHLSEPAPMEFSGDNPLRPHEALWAKDAFLRARGGLPEPSETVPVVIVGGGFSGLFSAWLLRDLKPVLLEQAPRFGGNAKGESWKGIDYSIGAAYFMEHEKGSAINRLFEELELYSLCRVKEEEDPVVVGGKLFTDFWNGATDPSRASEFRKVGGHFSDMFHGRNGLVYPEVPYSGEAMRKLVHELDRSSFYEYVRKVAGGAMHPHMATLLEHYCWSTLGAGMKSLSAAIALNAVVAEFGKAFVAPGGNSALAERVLDRISSSVPTDNLRAGSLVIDVRATPEGARVTYARPDGSLHGIACKAVVMACPKFVAAKVLHGMESERARAISRLTYHPYLVANVCLKGRAKQEFYDAYLLKDAKVNHDDPAGSYRHHLSTDLILANYSSPSDSHTVLSLYRALPWKEGRAELYAPGSYERVRASFDREIRAEILPMLGFAGDDLLELRITRWGHPLPVGAPGLIRRGIAERAHAPHRGRVFFVEQDNWMLAAIETCASEALRWAPEVRAAAATG